MLRSFLTVSALLGLGAAHALADDRSMLMLDTGGHMALIRDIVFTRDGKQLVSASDDKTIRVWDLEAGKTLRVIRGEVGPGNAGNILAMALSTDGKWLAVGGWTETPGSANGHPVRLYDFASGKLVALLTAHGDTVSGLAFSPDGKFLISGGSDHDAIIWDVDARSLKHRLKGHKDYIYAVGFTPDGARAVTGSYDHELRLWSVESGSEIARMRGHEDKVGSLVVTPDGNIASGDKAGEIRLWDGKTGALIKPVARQEAGVGDLSLSPDGRYLLAGVVGRHPFRCNVYELATGHKLFSYDKHDNIVTATAISADGRWAATGGGINNDIHVWDLKTGAQRLRSDGQPMVLAGAGRGVYAAGFSSDSRSIGWGNTDLGTVNSRREPYQFALSLPIGGGLFGHPIPLAEQEAATFTRAEPTHGPFSLSHRKGGNFGYDAILDLKEGDQVRTSMERGSTDGYMHDAYGFSPDGKAIISGGNNGYLTAYDLSGTKIGSFVGHTGEVWAATPSADGRLLVSGSDDQTVKIWDLASRELLATLFHGANGEWVMWTPEGFFTGSEAGANMVGWQINQGPDKEARYVSASQVRKLFFRTDLVEEKLRGDPDKKVEREAKRLDIDAILASGAAPKVTIVAPADKSEAPDKTVTVNVQIDDTGGGVGKVVWRVNGKVRGTSFGNKGLVSQTIDLGAEENVVEVTAFNSNGFVESEAARVTIKVDAKALKGIPDLYVLAVGVNKYKDANRKLDYAVSDARILSEALAAAGANYYRHKPHVVTLFDEDVTAERLTQTFDELGRQIKPGDVFLFFIAGHGKTVQGDYYFVPRSVDRFTNQSIQSQGFGPEMWQAWFAKIKAEKSVVIFDTCESGSAGRPFKSRGSGDYEAAYQRLKQATGQTILMAASDTQLAIEGYHGHGVFTYALLEALALSDADSNNEIELTELIKHLDVRVPQISRALKACETSGEDDYCQRPVVEYSGRSYTLVPRYDAILARLQTDEVVVPSKPTHVVLLAVDLYEKARGEGKVTGKLAPGNQVTLIKIEGQWAFLAQSGRPIGYIENREGTLLELTH